MALKNIEVADQGTKVVLFPKAKEAGTRFTLNASESKQLRAHVARYVEADSRELPYNDRLSANKRVGLKRNNGLLTGENAHVLEALMAAKARATGNAPAQSTPEPQAVAAGSGPRKRTNSDLTKMTKADLVKLIQKLQS